MKIDEILLSQILIDESQPRKNVKSAKIGILASSIIKQGLMNPIEVREVAKGVYKIIDGERRHRAFKLLKRDKIPCIIVSKVKDVFLRQAISDFHKEKLNVIEQGEVIVRLEKNYEVKYIQHLLGICQSTYYRLKRTNKYNDNTKKLILEGKLSPSALHNLNKHELKPEREDEIVRQIVKYRRITEGGIDRVIKKSQDFRWVINQHLVDTQVFNHKVKNFNVFLRKNEGLISEEVKKLIYPKYTELRGSLIVLREKSNEVLEIIKKVKELTSK